MRGQGQESIRRLVGLLVVALALGAAYYSWRSQHAAPVLATVSVGQGPTAIVLDAGHVFVANRYSDTVSVLDAMTGRVLQTTAITQPVATLNGLHLTRFAPFALAADMRTGRTFVATASPALSVLSTTSGRSQGIVPNRDMPTALASTDSAHLYIVGHATGRTSVSLLDVRRGRMLHIIRLDDPAPPANAGYGASVAVVDEHTGRAIVGSPWTEGSRAWVIDTRRGVVVRTMLTGQHVAAVALDTRVGRAFIVGGRAITVIDTRTGAIIRHFTTGVDLRAVAVDERSGHVFIADAGSGVSSSPGGVLVLDGRNGALLRTVAVGVAPEAIAVDPRRGHVLVVNGGAITGNSIPNSPITVTAPGSLSVLDARSASVVHTIGLGGSLGPIAIDARADRAFVLDGGGYAPPDRWGWVPGGLGRHIPFLPRRPTGLTAGSVTVLDLSAL